MEHDSPEPTVTPSPTGLAAPTARHACTERSRSDGWTGEKMATFCEALADTAVVAEACNEVGIHARHCEHWEHSNGASPGDWRVRMSTEPIQ